MGRRFVVQVRWGGRWHAQFSAADFSTADVWARTGGVAERDAWRIVKVSR